MAKKKLQAEEVDELFVLTTDRISETKKINIEIQDFLEKMDGHDDAFFYETPIFTMVGEKFKIVVVPGDQEICVELTGFSSASDPMDNEWIFRKQILEVNHGQRLSHEWYRRFVKENGDVLKLEAKVTVTKHHIKEEDWKRYF